MIVQFWSSVSNIENKKMVNVVAAPGPRDFSKVGFVKESVFVPLLPIMN